MDRSDARQLLQSVTRLVEKPDIRALELSLVATLGKIIKATSIRLCQLQVTPGAPEKRVLVYLDPDEVRPLEAAPGFAKCLETGQRTLVAVGQQLQAIHPIKVRSDIIGFLTIDCDTDDPHDQEIVSILLDFYRNYASLLYDAERDTLTGLLNRKSFYEKVLEVIGAQRDAPAGTVKACLAILDIDHFKHINDGYGHLVGDETLILFARAMVETFRGGDLLFRMGGEEFVVVLKDVDTTTAFGVLDRFREAMAQREFPQIGTMTVSIGLSRVLPGDLPMNTMDRADKALYYAKENGRNRACSYESLIEDGKLRAFPQQGNDVELF